MGDGGEANGAGSMSHKYDRLNCYAMTSSLVLHKHAFSGDQRFQESETTSDIFTTLTLYSRQFRNSEISLVGGLHMLQPTSFTLKLIRRPF